MTEQDDPADLKLRPPVVTVMGHVDHGKTSLLDAIRETAVTSGEFGGITQHIGAYNVKLSTGGSVTFLDTPGHEAFTAMRSRGAQITDIVVLVVAANDGVMPQTIEAINHAKAAGVPIIVAINKMDLENANPEKVINQLAEHELVPEEWGGSTLVCKLSAHTREGLDNLLENLHLQAEVLELRANPNRAAIGTVIESKVDKGRGPVISVLVHNGTLKKGDSFVAGAVSGKVRALVSDDGTSVEEAGPSIPVEVLGVGASAIAGDDFVVMSSDSQARKVAEDRAQRKRRKELATSNASSAAGGPLTLESFSQKVSDSVEIKELPLIIKADVQGSVEAVADALADLSNEEVKVNIIHKGVGAISENDVQLASASKAVLVAFNIRPDARALVLIEQEGIIVQYSRVIYDLVDSVGEALRGKMSPKFQEKTLGHVEVRQTFRVPKMGMVAGSYVTDGVVPRNSLVRVLRDGIVVHEGKLASLRRFKEDVKEVSTGYECGIGLQGFADIKDGDVLEVYKVEEIAN
jgi:translation initiation factor IF-2